MANAKSLIQLIALDLDGTLLNSSHQVTPRAAAAIRRAQEIGIKVVLATGKTLFSARQTMKELAIEAPGVFVQGTVIYNPDGSVRHQHTIPVEVLRRVIPFAEQRGCFVMVYSGERILVRQSDPRADLTKYHEPAPVVVGSLINALNNHAFNKVIIVGTDPRHAKAVSWQMQQMIGNEVKITFAGIPQQFEILPKGISKGQGVESVARDLGIDAAHVMAIGDADNDIEMLTYAGMGVAMGHASEAVKAAAKYITDDNDHEGVAEAIERYVLPKPAVEAPVVVTPAADAETKEATPKEGSDA